MKIIKPNNNDIENIIYPIDDSIITELAKIALKCTKSTERYNLRDELYSSIYNPKNLEQKEINLENYLEGLDKRKVRTENQNKEYKWVKINTENMGEIASRFYIAPNPDNMHEMVKELVDTFSNQDVPVRFKYQLTTGMKQCDRIIIYSDYQNKEKVEAAIKKVYQKNPSLFKGYERSLAWLYDTSIPGVYSAPETKGDAYSNRLTDVILEAKENFNYLYGITNKNSKLNLKGKEAEKAFQDMELLIKSLMLRKGILLTKDGKIITIKDKHIKSFYNYDTGELTNANWGENGYDEVTFFPTEEGKNALLKNFYSVSIIKPQKGIEKRHLTKEEKREEENRILFADFYKYKEQESQNKRK